MIRFLLVIITLSFSGIAWAASQLTTQFSGVSGRAEENVKKALTNEKAKIETPIDQVGIQFFIKKAPAAIKEALQPYGYFNPIIKTTSSRKGNLWTVNFQINPGPPTMLTQVSVGIIGPGQNDRAFKRIYQHLPIKVGDRLITENYEKAKQLLYDLASTRGYFDAEMLQNKIYINIKTNQAQIYLKFKTGHRYLFGKTSFSETPFNPRFLRRFLDYKKGRYYNYQKISKTQEDFVNSNYFSAAIITPNQKKSVEYQVPINIELTPRERFAYSFGAGYGTDTGPRGTAGYEIRRVNKYGHQFKTLIQAAKNNSYASASYLIPGRHPASDIWTLSGGYADFDQVTGNGKGYKIQAGYSTSIGRWKQTVNLTFLNERYNIVNFPFTKTQMLYPNINWQFISTKKKELYPKFGFSFSGFLGGTPKSSISAASFVQARVDLKTLMTFFHRTRLILRTSIARTEIDNLEQLPFSLQLWAGGARSVRGYSYNQIGPGKNLFVGSIELQEKIVGNWYLVGFFDMGNVTDRSAFDLHTMSEGAGPGIAWLSPIGVLELTVANAFTQPNKPWVVQFTMGPEL
ncbi:MAG: BamA/TamA family outer membrane protein [Coxiellaceae bacterium]|nr:BamA/TamA family outer membrane protein [Coxiellaceae bacterium]